MRILTLAVLSVVLASCAMDEREEEIVAARQDALGTAPTSLANYRWGTPLFPSTVRSVYVVFAQHPTDTSRFVAWGFDLVANRTLFFVSGDKRSDRSKLMQQVEADISIPVQLDVDFVHACGSQQGKKGPNDPSPPGGTDWTAFNNYGHNIALQLQLAVANGF